MTLPQRKYTLEIKIGADDKDALRKTIEGILYDLRLDERDEADIVSGGYDAGYYLTLKCNPEMTHDRYFELIDEHKTAMKGEKADR